MEQGPVPQGESVADEDAMTARYAVHDEEPWWLDGEEPDWPDGDMPPDPEGGVRVWPGEAAEMAALAAADQREQEQVRARVAAGGAEYGYAHVRGAPPVPGIKTGPGGGFGQGEPLDRAAPCLVLGMQADYASGPGRDFGGVCDDELLGLLSARQRLEARQAWERLMVIAELIRRRPALHAPVDKRSGMPAVWAEGTAGELAAQLAVTRRAADHLLGIAWDLTVKLPLTSVRLRDGIIDADKAAMICGCCSALTADEARQAEQVLFALDDVEEMTWGMMRDRIARAVIEVNPDAARKRREGAARQRRVEVRPEVSGNAMISGRELPPTAVLALDQKLTARARELRKLGVQGGMDELRVLAFLERWGEADPAGDLSGKNSDGGGGSDGGGSDGGGSDGGGRDPEPGGTGPAGSGGGACACGGTGGVAAVIHLTAPVVTLTEMAGRPGILRGTGPIDPDLVRELTDAAANHGKTVYEFTLTGPDGRPAAHACGTSGPGDQTRRGKTGKPAPPSGSPALNLVDRGPPGGPGTWRYTHGGREIIFEFEDLAGPCDHRHQAKGHDPGRKLRHLTGVLNQTCTHPACRRPEAQCDFEHSQPYDQDGITCLCQCGPVCRSDHQDKQRPGWKLEHAGNRGWFRWTTPSGRSYLSRPTIYPI